MPFAFRMVIRINILAVVICSLAAAMQQAAPVEISYFFASNPESLYEPVVLRFQVYNNLAQAITVDLGQDGTSNFKFFVVRPDGTQEQLRPPVKEGLTPVGIVKVGPGQTYTKEILLSNWLEFDRPGHYQISASLTDPIKDENGRIVPANSEGHINLELVPRDEKQLQTTCANLLKKISSAPSYQQADDAAKALSAIKDPVVVPYLKEATGFWHLEPITIPALDRIGDLTAVEALISLLSSKEHDTNLLARFALEKIENRTADSAIKDRIKLALKPSSIENQKPY